ncbi:MAG: hypothetical protein HYZ93_01905 [Candidatus Omnitrophica bacterium]|nr:hypothetical protein [Candidatus Omnitrophota bacterium]
MDSPSRQRLILGLLGGLVAVTWTYGLLATPARSKRPAAAAPQRSQTQEPKSEISRPQALRSRYAEWGVNPFEMERRTSAPTSPAGERAGHWVKGILWDANVPSAIVDGRLVSVGDHVDGWRVIEIQKDRVVLSNGESTQTLTVE